MTALIIRLLFQSWFGGFVFGFIVATVLGAVFEAMGWGKDGFK